MCVRWWKNPHINVFSTAVKHSSDLPDASVRFWALHSIKLESNTLKHAHALHRTNVPGDATLDCSLALSRIHLSQTHRHHFSFQSPVNVGKGFFGSHKWIFTTDFPNQRELSAIWHCISVVRLCIIRVSLVISVLLILSDGKHLEFYTHCCCCRLQNLLEFFKTGQISHKLWGWAGIDAVPLKPGLDKESMNVNSSAVLCCAQHWQLYVPFWCAE